MPLKPLWNQNDIKKRREFIQSVLAKRIFEMLSYTGEQFVAVARQLADFEDQTGNLRASIGYVIVKDGKVVKYDFNSSKVGTEGAQIGLKHAKKLASEFSQGWVLIGVAGMDYAAAVESKGFEVISTSSVAVARRLRERIIEFKKVF